MQKNKLLTHKDGLGVLLIPIKPPYYAGKVAYDHNSREWIAEDPKPSSLFPTMELALASLMAQIKTKEGR